MRKFSVLATAFLLLGSILSAEDASSKPVLGVMNFDYSGISEQELKVFVDFVASHIHKTDAFVVIDRMQRESLLREIEFSKTDCTDEQCALEIGKLLSASLIVVGSIGRVGSRYILNMKLVEVETGRTLETASQMYGDIDALIDDSAAQTLSLLGDEIDADEVSVSELSASEATELSDKVQDASEKKSEPVGETAAATPADTEKANPSVPSSDRSGSDETASSVVGTPWEDAAQQRTHDRLDRLIDAEEFAAWALENKYRPSLDSYAVDLQIELMNEYLDSTTRGLSLDAGLCLLFNYAPAVSWLTLGAGGFIGPTYFFANGMSLGLHLLVDGEYMRWIEDGQPVTDAFLSFAVVVPMVFGRKPAGAGWGVQIGLQGSRGSIYFQIALLLGLRGVTLGYGIAFDREGVRRNQITCGYSFGVPTRLR